MKVLQAQSKKQKHSIEFLLRKDKIKFDTKYDRKNALYNIEIKAQAKSTRSADHISYLLKDIIKSTVVRKPSKKGKTKVHKAQVVTKTPTVKINPKDLEVTKIAKDTNSIMHKGKLLENVSDCCVDVALKQWAGRSI